MAAVIHEMMEESIIYLEMQFCRVRFLHFKEAIRVPVLQWRGDAVQSKCAIVCKIFCPCKVNMQVHHKLF